MVWVITTAQGGPLYFRDTEAEARRDAAAWQIELDSSGHQGVEVIVYEGDADEGEA